MKISVAIITKNEVQYLSGCLESVTFADEIVVVDDFSSDNTVSIARKFGAKVYLRHLDTLGKQKQFALEKCHGDWILQLDADERISPKLKTEIFAALKNQDYDAFNIFFHQYAFGKPLVPSLQGGHPRLFHNGVGYFLPTPIHEGPFVTTGSRMGQLKNPIIHHSHQSIEQMLRKINNYTNLEAKLLYEKGIRVNILKLLLAPIVTIYFRQLRDHDWRSGTRGIIISLLFSFYNFLKWAKVWQLEMKNK